MSEIYADILLPLALPAFTYRVEEGLREIIGPGVCVEVSLGKNKVYAGVVWRVHSQKPGYKNMRSVSSVVAGAPVITAQQMRFWEWIADYYMCETGMVMRAALPSSLKPSGLSHDEFADAVYKPPVVRYYSLGTAVPDADTLNAALDKLASRAPQQYRAVMDFIEVAGEQTLFSAMVERRELASDTIILGKLVKKGIFTSMDKELEPGVLPPLPTTMPLLSMAQSSALDSVDKLFKGKDAALLHGVTGSGKTEIYINLIGRELSRGRNVLYLMPEIAMTAQLITRIKRWFGERVITYHSSFNTRARVEAYRRANRSTGGELILGVRSSIFLPADNLGLVIVDEEHDPGFKSSDSPPRYHARDAAIVLAKIMGAKVLMGSATPSLESYANASSGKYGYVALDERYGGASMPDILVSDTLLAAKRGERRSHFNKLLLDHIDKTLAEGEQVMLFQNRRGYSPYVECGECGWVSSCPDCSVTLTLHKSENRLRCHYCGHNSALPHVCPACGLPSIETRGFGTEKIEEELAAIFPDARIERLDRDAVKSPKRYNSIISGFENRQIDILVGTQMITKGFDFEGVSLVGVMNADNLLAYPDFRAAERAFQLITQVAGRAGRRDKKGTVIIQTSQPSDKLIIQAAQGDYPAMARTQLAERAEFFYPPYCRLLTVTLRHRDMDLLKGAAELLGNNARVVFGRRLSGPMPPPVDRIRGEYILFFVLKVEKERSFAKAKRILGEMIKEVGGNSKYRTVSVSVNVDPQ